MFCQIHPRQWDNEEWVSFCWNEIGRFDFAEWLSNTDNFFGIFLALNIYPCSYCPTVANWVIIRPPPFGVSLILWMVFDGIGSTRITYRNWYWKVLVIVRKFVLHLYPYYPWIICINDTKQIMNSPISLCSLIVFVECLISQFYWTHRRNDSNFTFLFGELLLEF